MCIAIATLTYKLTNYKTVATGQPGYLHRPELHY